MADFPTDLTNAVDDTTDVLAKHLNNLEAKVGVNGSAVTTSIDYLLKALPEGTLINGKIVPSVVSNDLVVTLKGMDGNDPSAGNPVYCIIGGVVRSITSALSVTKADGTNWCNAGSTGLAAKEIDYFVYLGYNATDGIVIGFSRVPYATLYSDFSTTTTNEKYAGISTITNAAAGDSYVNVGRFAATLSAGAGYTWTVPTFTASNLIQRPIYETRWLNWTPTQGTSGDAYTNAPTISSAIYKIMGRAVFIRFKYAYNATSGGTGVSTYTLPIAPAESYISGTAADFSSIALLGAGYFTSTVYVFNPNGTTPIVNSHTIGTGLVFNI